MDANNGRPTAPSGEPAMDSGDWRTQLQPDSRQRIVNKIMETLKKHLPFSGQEGLLELKKIAIRFEEKIYTAATGQSDYLRKIALKMLTMEDMSQNTMLNSLPSNFAGSGNEPVDSGASVDSTAQTGHTNGGDWQEEVFQKANHALMEEREINQRLIHTVVDISDEDVDPTVVAAAAAAEGGEGTIIKCSKSKEHQSESKEFQEKIKMLQSNLNDLLLSQKFKTTLNVISLILCAFVFLLSLWNIKLITST